MKRVIIYVLAASLIVAITLVGACGAKQYELTTSVEPAGAGSVSPSGGTHDEGTPVTLTATPDAGYVFDRWSGDASGTSKSQTVTMNTDMNITAHFSVEEPETMTYTVNIITEPDGSGSVSPSGGTYEEGTEITLTATPKPGYIFEWWGGDASSALESVTITVNGDKNIVVHFSLKPEIKEPQQYTLTTSVDPAGSGSVSPSGGTHNLHARVTITATASEGYVFQHWSGDAAGTNDSVTVTMDSDITVTAHFAEIAEFKLTSPAFIESGDIPVMYTCDGQDISPALSWVGIPAGTRSFVLLVDDPDAPMGVFTHWVVYNIPANVRGLNENIPIQTELSDGTLQGINNFGESGYGGPCPPQGQRHEYRFILYALDSTIDLSPYGATRQKVLEAIQDHILEEVQMSGYYRS